MRKKYMLSVLGALCALLLGAPAAGAQPVGTTYAIPMPDAPPLAGTPQKAPPSTLPQQQSADATSASTDCALGYVCIRYGDVWDGGDNHPVVARYYDYGTYNLSGYYGDYSIYNNQTGGAKISFYSGYNGTGSLLYTLEPNEGYLFVYDMTPVNSVRLHP